MFPYGKSFAVAVWLIDVVASASVLDVEEYMVFIFDSLVYAELACFGAIAGVLSFLAKRVPLYEFRPILWLLCFGYLEAIPTLENAFFGAATMTSNDSHRSSVVF